MLLDAVLTPAEIAGLPERDLRAWTCVVFDVLRATSSMITALAHGAKAIHPVATIEAALSMRADLPDAILGGERHGDRIPGFDLGNAPQEYVDTAGATIVTTTTNGTVALRACEGAGSVLVGALLNLGAVVEALREARAAQVLLVCAGTFQEFALEDGYAAGLLAEAFPEAETTDAVQALRSVAHGFPRPLGALRASRNGRALEAKGRAAEVEWCAAVSKYKVVGGMRLGTIQALQP